jgi:hypothetical protein
MQVKMEIRSITVPTDSQIVLVGVDLGVPGATGEFRFTPEQAMQLANDLYAAGQNARGGIITPSNAAGGRHFSLDAETIRYGIKGSGMGG